MIHHEVIQGTTKWEALRHEYDTASEAPIIMGANKNHSRNDLLEAKATQTPKEFSSFVIDVVFEKGHETEEMARPLVEQMIGEELYPVTGSTGKFLASYDGMNMLDTKSMEHKQWNKVLAEMVKEKQLPLLIVWQLEHQFEACDTLESIIFVVSDGTTNNFEWLEYRSNPEMRSRLRDGWEQFKKDRAAFKPKEKKPEAVGKAPQSLPALVIDISGELTTSSNLEAFKASTMALIANIKTDLKTDEDFANAGAAVKFLDDAEKQSELVKAQALSKTANLEKLFIAIDEMKALMRTTRLNLNKKVTADKANRKTALVKAGNDAADAYIIEVNKEFAEHGIQVIGVAIDLYTSIKGKSSFDNMESTIDDEVARFKIECSQRSNRIRASLNILKDKAADYMFLFPNLQELVALEHDHLKLTIDSKINQYKEDERVKEQKRKAGCQLAIDGFNKAAYNAMQSTDLNALTMARAAVERISTAGMLEFQEAGDKAKADALAAFDNQIGEVNRQNAANETTSATEISVSKLQPETHDQEGFETLDFKDIDNSSEQHDDALPGRDDLEAEPTCKVTVTPEDMRSAILAVLDDKEGGINTLLLYNITPDAALLEVWRDILKSVL